MSKANSTHISLETAKLLKDCGVESEYYWVHDLMGGLDNETRRGNIPKDVYSWNFYPAYTWQEILWEYPQEFFGDNLISTYYYADNFPHCENMEYYSDGGNEVKYTEKAYKRHSRIVLGLLQAKLYDEADQYFRESCCKGHDMGRFRKKIY